MSVMFRYTLIPLFMLLYLSACSDTQQEANKHPLTPATGVAEDTYQPEQYKLNDPNYLRQRIPQEALAYIRIPQLFAFLSAPKGDVFTRALAQEEHQKLIGPLKENIYHVLANDKSDLLKPLAAFWVQHSRTPLEFILLSNERQQPLPRVLMTTTLDFNNMESFAEFLQKLVKMEQNLYVIKDNVNENGHASLASGPLSIELKYDVNSKQLRLMAGMGIDRDMMVKNFAQLQVQQSHPMYAPEGEIDSSHQGLFVWLNIENILPVVSNTVPPEVNQQINNTLLAEAKALSAGIGVSHGKGRLKLVADFNKDALSHSLPTGGMDMNLTASGQPRALAALSLISASQLTQLEQKLSKLYPGKGVADYQAFKQKFTETMGMSLEEVLTAVGPDVLFLQDQLGEYSAIAVRDMALYRQLLARWVNTGKIDYKKTDINGVTIHYMKTTPWFMPPADSPEIKHNPFIDLLLKARSHAYWVEEDGYLVFAAVPQLLLDRRRYTQKIAVSDWLKQQQRQETSSALLLASSRIQGTPAKLYYAYLQTLLFLGDISGTDIDISSLPSATTASLPSSGTYGFQLSVSDQQVFAELVYENNPAEIVLGQNMGSVAVIGILAAVAIPAYQDYTIRAKVNQAFTQAQAARRWIEDYHQQHGKFPPQAAIDRYDFGDIADTSISAINIVPQTGQIIMTLAGHARIENKRLSLKPHNLDHGLNWKCSGDLQAKYLPPACR